MGKLEEKISTNPELPLLNFIIGDWLNQLIDQGWAKGLLEVNVSGGKINNISRDIKLSDQIDVEGKIVPKRKPVKDCFT